MSGLFGSLEYPPIKQTTYTSVEIVQVKKKAKPKLTERQRFERWYSRLPGLLSGIREDLWGAWQASARARR